MQSKRSFWRTRFGFYLAAMGSACGLGNLWRFPYVVGENGGGAFVLLYVLLALVLGAPLLIGELMLGKSTRKSVVAAMATLEQRPAKPFVWIGRMSVLLTLMVLAYYAVISGWALHFATQFLIGVLSPETLHEKGRLDQLLSNGWLQMGLASVHLLIAVVVVLKGVQEGIERWIGAMMPIFSVLLILLVVKSLSLSSSAEALRFLFYPDFSKLTLSSPLHAIGHICFTLSVGFGTLVTFGSYLRDSDHIPTAGFRVTMVDTFLSLLAGLLLFPIVIEASNIPLTDPGLLFEALPRFLLQMPGGVIFGLAFFICLYLAALGATIGLLEVIVSNLGDRLKLKRSTASWVAGVTALALGIFPALSSSTLKGFRISGKSMLELVDSFMINLLLPLIALGVSLAIAYGMKQKDKENLFIDENRLESVSMFPHWTQAIHYIIPAIICGAIFLQILSFL